VNKEVILTGLRSNSEFHIGNYLGAILPMVQLQHGLKDQYQLNMFVPDLHSFTTPIDHSKLYRQTIDNIKVYVAAGLDLEHSGTFVYRQSHIPAHAELTWILDCFAYFGELSRMTEFKEKSDAQANVSVGLFNYPVLMAADILLYGATWVPVGEDQRQHLELTRDLAIRLNNKFGDVFTVPNEWEKQLEFVGLDRGIRIRSLRTPEKKMSKSIEDPAGTIMLTDNPDEAASKVMSATTDSVGTINYDWDKQPGVTNLLQMLALCQGRAQSDVNGEWAGKSSYGDLKSAVAESVKKVLIDLQNNLSNVDEGRVMSRIEEDEHAMTEVANNTLNKVQRAVGLRQ
jgi:tryptophanyl-tRNA synthetase